MMAMEDKIVQDEWIFNTSQPLHIWSRSPSDQIKTWEFKCKDYEVGTIKLPYGLEFSLQIYDSKIPNKLAVLADELPEKFPVRRLVLFGFAEDEIHNLTPLNRLSSLTNLNLRQTDVTGEDLSNIQLPNLKILELPYCEWFNDKSVSSLIHFNSLRQLSLAGCPITDKSLEIIGSQFNLEAIVLSGCEITDDGIKELQNNKNLQYIYLNTCMKVTNLGVSFLEPLKLLEIIDLGNCRRVTDDGVKYLASFPKLSELNLSGCTLSDKGMAVLGELTNLQKLDVSSTQITDQGLSEINRLEKLEELKLNYCENISNIELASLASIRKLQKLQLWGFGKISNESLSFLKEFPELTELELCDRHLTDKSLEIISSLIQLKKLNLFRCHGITDSGFLFLSKLSNLNWLNIANCTNLSEKTIERLRHIINLDLISYGNKLDKPDHEQSNNKQEDNMQKWEYKTCNWWRGIKGVFAGGNAMDWKSDFNLDQLGNEGWELISAIPQSDISGDQFSGVTTKVTFIFKRPLNSN